MARSKATLGKGIFLLVGKTEAMKQGQRLKVDRRLRGDITAVVKYIKGCRKKEREQSILHFQDKWDKNNRLKSQ